MHVNARLVAAAVLWFSSILLMTISVSLPEGSHVAGWAILTALAGTVPIGWLVIDHVVTRERQRTQEEIQGIVRVVLDEVRNLRSV